VYAGGLVFDGTGAPAAEADVAVEDVRGELATVVRHDGRDTGSSSRGVAGVSLGAQVLDLEAVIDGVSSEPAAVLGVFHTAILASSTVRDLVAGSDIAFDDRGIHLLEGIPGEWRVFSVRS
jgi:hypothetical protein